VLAPGTIKAQQLIQKMEKGMKSYDELDKNL